MKINIPKGDSFDIDELNSFILRSRRVPWDVSGARQNGIKYILENQMQGNTFGTRTVFLRDIAPVPIWKVSFQNTSSYVLVSNGEDTYDMKSEFLFRNSDLGRSPEAIERKIREAKEFQKACFSEAMERFPVRGPESMRGYNQTLYGSFRYQNIIEHCANDRYPILGFSGHDSVIFEKPIDPRNEGRVVKPITILSTRYFGGLII